MRHSHRREIRSGVKGIVVDESTLEQQGAEAVGPGGKCARLLDHVSDGNIIVCTVVSVSLAWLSKSGNVDGREVMENLPNGQGISAVQ
jgi:hypothetical protein